jgi:hypothetical protein
MKKKVLFLVFKIIELPILAYVPWWIGSVMEPEAYFWGQWLFGAFAIFLTLIILFIFVTGLIGLVKGNWALAKHFAGDKRPKS